MAMSKEFVGNGVIRKTPSGSQVHVALGHVTDEDNKKLRAIAIQIKDKEGTLVTEFAMGPETFEALITAIKQLYEVIGDEHSI